MKRTSLLALDMLQKEELAALKGGNASTNKVCACICVGPISTGKTELGTKIDRELTSSDEECTVIGASNAHRVANELIPV